MRSNGVSPEHANGAVLEAKSSVAAEGNVGLDDLRVHEAMEDYLKRLQAGEQPDREAFLALYPDVAQALAACLQGLDFVHAAGAELSHPAEGRTGGAAAQLPECLGDFRIVREVGRGGMGVVYEAVQLSLGRRVALKVLPFAATMDPRQLQRFQNEARAAAGLHHTHIVPVHAVGCERGVHFYAMQFIDGQTLAQHIDQLRGQPADAVTAPPDSPPVDEPTVAYTTTPAQPMADTAQAAASTTQRPPPEKSYFRRIAEWGIQAAEALEYAHSVGVVHRDIKPANLLVDNQGQLWVTDFGLARTAADSGLTMTGDLLGTLRYMSPEQALAKHGLVDHHTDIYSLGVTLYELLTLRPAVDGKDREEVLQHIAFGEPVPPRRWEKVIPAELETIVLKAMDKSPSARYATAQELADDLRRWLTDQPIRARRPSLVQRCRKWERRHRPLALAGLAVCLMALSLAGYIGWTRYTRAQQRTALAQVALDALGESLSWQKQRRLPEALSAARRAAGLVTGGNVDEPLEQQVRARLADLEFWDRLENVRLEHGLVMTRVGVPDYGTLDGLYARKFREAGFDVDALPVEQVAEQIRQTTVAVELAAVLDEWAQVRRSARGAGESLPGALDMLNVPRKVREPKDSSWKELVKLAQRVDPDSQRTQLRTIILQGDRQARRAAAAAAATKDLPPITVHVLAKLLMSDNEARDVTERFLRAAQRHHPGDFYLNNDLAVLFMNIWPPQRLEDAYHFATVAVALRPGSSTAHRNLASAFQLKGQFDDAIAENREAIRLQNDNVIARYELARALHSRGLTDEAILELREIIRLNRNFADAHNLLAGALASKKPSEEAIHEYREAIRLEPDDPLAYGNLGNCLIATGQFRAAMKPLRRARELGTQVPDMCRWVNSMLDSAQRLDRLEARLERSERSRQARFFYRQEKVDGPADYFALGFFCAINGYNGAAVQFYADAFAAQPALAEDLAVWRRLDAARSAAASAWAHADLSEKQRAYFRGKALEWLRADLQALQRLGKESATTVAFRTHKLLQESAFADSRDPKVLARLPAAERREWTQLWSDISAALAKSQAHGPADKKSDKKWLPHGME